jgi:hypothetical protein
MSVANAVGTARKNAVDAVFLLGVEEVTAPGFHSATIPERHGDELWLPCPDAYATLPQRTRWCCQWALSGDCGFDFDYILKADDDTFIHIPRLMEYADRLSVDGIDYAGAEWKPRVGYGSGGGGYLLSKKAASIVAERMSQKTGCEDLIVGQILRAAGIKLEIEPRFIPFGSMDVTRRPTASNNLITTHGVGRDVFDACWRECGGKNWR